MMLYPHSRHRNEDQNWRVFQRVDLAVQAQTTDPLSLNHLRQATSAQEVPPFHVGIVIEPSFIPMDLVGIQTVSV